jgi:hypothetical protein
MSDPEPVTEAPRERLVALRQGLLLLHKALVNAERVAYERANGRVASSGALLQLVIHDPWFAWLRPVSELVVRVDEWLDGDELPPPQDVEAFLTEVRTLLTPADLELGEGIGFGTAYFDLLQRDPDVVLAHAAVSRLLT